MGFFLPSLLLLSLIFTSLFRVNPSLVNPRPFVNSVWPSLILQSSSGQTRFSLTHQLPFPLFFPLLPRASSPVLNISGESGRVCSSIPPFYPYPFSLSSSPFSLGRWVVVVVVAPIAHSSGSLTPPFFRISRLSDLVDEG